MKNQNEFTRKVRKYRMELYFVIPAYQPTEKLQSVISNLCKRYSDYGGINSSIVVVDDGSEAEYVNFFLTSQPEGFVDSHTFQLLRHAVNLGKGRALKTAFNYILNETKYVDGIVTLDCDGQHLQEDVDLCIDAFGRNKSALILGSRDFNTLGVPLKSRLGNKLTRKVMRYLCGIDVSDTQTGLRVIPRALILPLMNVQGERFEFETNMLLEAKNLGIPIVEVPISTTYEDGNKSTHFNAVGDSLRIYSIFLKYAVASLSTFAIDFAVFILLVSMMKPVFTYYILLSTIGSRACAAVWNFLINKRFVFKFTGNRYAPLKYIALLLANMFISGEGTSFLFRALPFLHVVGAKVVIDAIMYFVNFWVQRKYVFRSEI